MVSRIQTLSMTKAFKLESIQKRKMIAREDYSVVRHWATLPTSFTVLLKKFTIIREKKQKIS